ncbi:hypothetical protein QFZ66_007850 [Streptomyces sp. B4I13]|nr:hypothetical protein [Streptomyces sp. B4I13]
MAAANDRERPAAARESEAFRTQPTCTPSPASCGG